MIAWACSSDALGGVDVDRIMDWSHAVRPANAAPIAERAELPCIQEKQRAFHSSTEHTLFPRLHLFSLTP